jgi:hypothetical protein
MTITISAEDARSIKAIEIAAGAGQWLKCRTRDGRKLYAVPSQSEPGVYHLTDAQSCDCQDFKRHGLSGVRLGHTGEHRPCKHILAVRLHCELVKGQQVQPKRRHLHVVPTAADYDRIFSTFEGA